MILADLVSSISHALPHLISESGWQFPDEEGVGSDIRYAFLRPDGSGHIGILPLGENSLAAGRMAQKRFGAHMLHWNRDTDHLEQEFLPVKAERILVVWKQSGAIERALAHLGQHYAEPVGLSRLAAVACVSKFHLVRLFNATLGVTPHRYQLMLRLSGAKAMLRDGARITEAAHGVGFSDNSHLNRSFRSMLGMTPTQYQQRLWQDQASTFPIA